MGLRDLLARYSLGLYPNGEPMPAGAVQLLLMLPPLSRLPDFWSGGSNTCCRVARRVPNRATAPLATLSPSSCPVSLLPLQRSSG
jgi:hypothetical protein